MDPLKFDQDTLSRFQRAKARGVPDEVNLQKAVQYQASKAQTMLPQEPEVKNKWADLLPLVGAVGGSFIGSPILGGVLGAGGGSLLKNIIQGQSLNAGEAVKEGAFAGAGGLVGKGLGWGASKLFPGLAEGAGNLAEKLALKAFRPNPSQLTEFAGTTGEDLAGFLSKRGFAGLDDVVKQADILQGQFDNVVMNKNLVVDPIKIAGGFDEQIARLNKSILPADKAKAQVLQEIKNNFQLQYGGKPIGADELTTLRREVDQGIKDFALDPSIKTPLNLTRDVFQNSLRETADQAGINIGGKGLKDTGVELSKLYKAIEIGERQANLGRGAMPTRLTSLLGAGIGGATGGLPGAAAGYAATQAINNPNTLSLLSKITSAFGQGASKIPGAPEAAIPILTRAGLVTGAAGGQGEGQGMGQPTQQTTELPSDMASPTGLGGETDQNAKLRKVIGAFALSKAKNVSDLKTALELIQGQQAKPLTAEQQKISANAQSGLRALGLMEQIMNKDPLAVVKSKVPGIAGRSPYATASREIADVLTRLRTGAALNEQEQKFYISQLPDILDSPETIQYKIKLFRDLFTQLGYHQTPATPELDISSFTSQ